MTGVRLTRKSVAMGDDAWAPHEWEFTVAPGTTLAELVQIALDDHYLATVSGGRATWVVEVEVERRPLAVVAQQWREPRWVVDPNVPLTAVAGVYDPRHDRAELHFLYLTQRDPDAVFAGLAGPERYDHPTVTREQPPRPAPPW